MDYYSNTPTIKVISGAHEALEALHFDSLNSPIEIKNYWDRLTINSKISFQEAARNNDAFEVLMLLGTSLHAVQDFYTHSNWPEIISERSGNDYATRTWFDATNDQRSAARTGDYYEGQGSKPTDHGDYDRGMNHDSQSRPNFHIAYTFGYAASRQWVNQVKLWVEEINPNVWNNAKNMNYSYWTAGDSIIRPDLDSSLGSAYRVSEWVTPNNSDGHWKGKGSGTTVPFGMASASWIAQRPSIFTVRFMDFVTPSRNIYFKLTKADGNGRIDLRKNGNAAVDASLVPSITKIPINKKMVIVRATRIKEIENPWYEPNIDPGGKPDFYAKVWIDGKMFLENTFQDRQEVINPWEIMTFVDADRDNVHIHIEVWDEDLPYNDDDHIDINPGPSRNLDMTFYVQSHQLTGDINGSNFDYHEHPWGETGNDTDKAFMQAYVTARTLFNP